MLNEVKEYEEYTFPLDTAAPSGRLKHRTICNSLSGTQRAMKMIARKSLSAGERDIEHAINDLRVWSGDRKGNAEEASEGIAADWLPDYIIRILGEEKCSSFARYLTQDDLGTQPYYREVCEMLGYIQDHFSIKAFREKDERDRMLEYMEKIKLYSPELGETEAQKKKTARECGQLYNVFKALNILYGRFSAGGFNKKLFDNQLARTEKNDFKKITYEKIVADAITEGPLKRYYLVCRRPDFLEIGFRTEKKTDFPFKKNIKKNGESIWSEPMRKKADFLMKITAAFLLEQNARGAKRPYEGPAPVNRADIYNWQFGETAFDISKFSIASRPLFISEMIDNVAVIGIDREWMESCGWAVIAEEALETYLKENPDAVFFSDAGSGKYLIRDQRYT